MPTEQVRHDAANVIKRIIAMRRSQVKHVIDNGTETSGDLISAHCVFKTSEFGIQAACYECMYQESIRFFLDKINLMIKHPDEYDGDVVWSRLAKFIIEDMISEGTDQGWSSKRIYRMIVMHIPPASLRNIGW